MIHTSEKAADCRRDLTDEHQEPNGLGTCPLVDHPLDDEVEWADAARADPEHDGGDAAHAVLLEDPEHQDADGHDELHDDEERQRLDAAHGD